METEHEQNNCGVADWSLNCGSILTVERTELTHRHAGGRVAAVPSRFCSRGAARRTVLAVPLTPRPTATCGAWPASPRGNRVWSARRDGRWLTADATLTRWLALDAGDRDAAGPGPADGLRALAPQPAPFADFTGSGPTGGSRCQRREAARSRSGWRRCGAIPASGTVSPRWHSCGRARARRGRAGERRRGSARTPRPVFCRCPGRHRRRRSLGPFSQANRALRALLGADPQDLVGRQLTDWLHRDDRGGVLATLETAADRDEDPATVEIRLAPPHERTLVML